MASYPQPQNIFKMGTEENYNPESVAYMDVLKKHAAGTLDIQKDTALNMLKYMSSSTANQGSEFIPTPTAAYYVGYMIERSWARQAFPQRTMQVGITETIPKDTSMMTADYIATEIFDLDTANYYDETNPRTSSVTLTLRTFTINLQVQNKHIAYNAVANMGAEYERKIRDYALLLEEDAFINGDNSATTSANMNNAYNASNHSHGVGTAAGQNRHLVAFNGLRKAATGSTVSVGGVAASVSDFMTAFKNMGGRFAQNPADTLVIVSFDLALAMMRFAQLETLEKYGPQATILSGEIGRLYNRRVIVSNRMPTAEKWQIEGATTGSNTLTDTAGNRNSTGGLNLYTEALVLHREAPLIGNPADAGRRFSLVREERPRQDRFHLIARWDVGFTLQHPEAVVRMVGILA